jgi:hypothetical protein
MHGSLSESSDKTSLHLTQHASSPDRWDNLPETVAAQPGLFSNILTFSAGPRVRHLMTSDYAHSNANTCSRA